MKKTICIILSALIISVFFVIGAFASSAFMGYNMYVSTSGNLDTLTAITSATEENMPISYDSGSRGNFLYFVIDMPSYESLNSMEAVMSFSSGSGSTKSFLLFDEYGSFIRASANSTSIDLSSDIGVKTIVYKTGLSSGITLNSAEFDLDYVSPSVWEGIGDFIPGMFGAIGAIITGIIGSENNIILLFVIAIPLGAIAIGYFIKFIGKKRKRGK